MYGSAGRSIDPDRLAAQLTALPHPFKIEIVPETGSTNTDLMTRLRASKMLEQPIARIAYRQTAGRGQRGRRWAMRAMGCSSILDARRRVIKSVLVEPVSGTISILKGCGSAVSCAASRSGSMLRPALPYIFERSQRFCDQCFLGIAHFAFTVSQRGGFMQHARQRVQTPLPRLHEIRFQFNGNHIGVRD